ARYFCGSFGSPTALAWSMTPSQPLRLLFTKALYASRPASSVVDQLLYPLKGVKVEHSTWIRFSWLRAMSCCRAAIGAAPVDGLGPKLLIGKSEMMTHLTPAWEITSVLKRRCAFGPPPSSSALSPLIPELSTPTSRPACTRRPASTSVQRLFASCVLPKPPVIGAPSATTDRRAS